ncbi:hypothetical protein Y032_0313g2205 [Ancylostoma ceylanicum]|uniref:Hydantoinase/oxoprolinase n=1 Tax=Ancylostoma ceylanicum TaxID=53326 RepID=A0A016S1Z8_9BILA|nr:hypothetical protein Y032_0313g2205 [Ancylostoma ceylanicum]
MTGFGFAIDRGGTFTDVCVFRPDGSTRVLKVLSEDPANYRDAPTEAIRQVLEQETGVSIPRGTPVPTDKISWIRMGTTVATNALLERKGERIALLITKGFKDLLFIGNQTRPRIFDFDIQIPPVLYEEVVEVDERVVPYDESCQMHDVGDAKQTAFGKQVIVEKEPDSEEVKKILISIARKGIKSIAVVFLHSFVYPLHELRIKELAAELGFTSISLSHEVMPMIKVVPRGFTVCADAYLTPKIREYIEGFESGFSDGLKSVRVDFMQSDGGLCNVNSFFGSKAILSGPAGGVIGVALTAYDPETKRPVIGFDMGGTSTDVCRYSGALEHVMETTTAGVTIQAPQLDINTVAAGGGSRLFFTNGIFVVGPESVGAHPGPVCYRKGGHLSITDANLVLGRILPEYFPKIFGPNGNEALDSAAAYSAMEALTAEINDFVKKNPDALQKQYTTEEVALGFITVANEEMCRPIRALTQARGFDTSAHVLACFGGAGGQHACAVAQLLGVRRVVIHKYSSLLSAYGIALAKVVSEVQEPANFVFSRESMPVIAERFAALSEKATNELSSQGFAVVHCEYFLHMRFARTDCAIMITANYDPQDSDTLLNFVTAFNATYRREFGFILEDRDIIIDDIRIRGVASSGIEQNEQIGVADDPEHPRAVGSTKTFFEGGFLDISIYNKKDLYAGHIIHGPAVILDRNSTIVVEPRCTASITPEGNIHLDVCAKREESVVLKVDPIRLSIFSNRFMSIAEQMGRVLQRTAISTNIKERLDFSCALFDPEGGLIANAPHIPVHLGGMQYAVRFQIDHLGKDSIHEGDVILSNHPRAGGSHLPDLTVITPVFFENISKPVFFLANRGHHADIGGLVPGSMPPNATSLQQEGATFISFKVVDKGTFREDALIEHLMAPKAVPGCSGTRNLADNIADIKAQIAANNKGISLVCDLISEYGLETVQAYMQHIQATAEESVRNMLKEVGRDVFERTGSTRLQACDSMDDGTKIQLAVTIDIEKGEALFDFTGTGMEVVSSCNCPRAVTMSAIIYCLRCLVAKDIPLNSGCLAPISISIPEGTLLSPSETAAVVGGNVLTSQRLCDVILGAFEAVAASQGCMNNVTFGDETMGYYETIAGGAGAGEGFEGRSGVHTHMTNTRITDPEILESRYPVILREFRLRENSGGTGKWRGGDGVVRALQFRRPLSLSLLTERRVFAPYGLQGGGSGACGLNLLKRKSRTVNLGGKITIAIEPGDILELRTPGGGGFGKKPT